MSTRIFRFALENNSSSRKCGDLLSALHWDR